MVTVNVISFHANSKRRHLILEAGWNPALGAVRQRWFPPEDGDLESHKGQGGPEVGFWGSWKFQSEPAYFRRVTD